MPDFFSAKQRKINRQGSLSQKLAAPDILVLRAFWRLRAPLLGKWW
jgi:hypothetical protein